MRTRNILPALALGLGLAGLIVVPSPAADDRKAESSPVDSGKIGKLIEQLGSDTFAEREAATKALAKIGMPALGGLRKAAGSKDSEVRKRAKELLVKLEAEAATAEILSPTRLHLAYKDVPLADAVADFKKKGGALIVVHDPDKKLKGKKVTLDTGKTTFWDALDQFCRAAGVNEGDPNAANMPKGPGGAMPPGAAFPPLGMPGGGMMMPPGMMPMGMAGGQAGQITLLPGKPARVASDFSSSIRVRQAEKNRLPGVPAKAEIGLVLEVTPEPRLRWQSLVSITVSKAVDDNGVRLKQVENKPAPAPAGLPGGGGIIINIGGAGGMAVFPAGGGVGMWAPASASGLSRYLPVHLVKGDKESKSLKELSGTIAAHVLGPAKPVIAIDGLMKAADKTVKGTAGGQIKVESATKNADGMVTVQFEFTQPADITPETQLAHPAAPVPGGPVRIRVVPPAKVAPGAGGAALPGKPIARPGIALVPGGVVMPMQSYAPFGLTLRDAKDNVLPATIQMDFRKGFRPGGGPQSFMATYRPAKGGPAEPARLVFTGRKTVLVQIPFTLKNVDLK